MFTNFAHGISGGTVRRLRAIGQPENFFAGLPDPLVPLPRNVLLFCKRTFDRLPKQTSHHRHMLVINVQTAATMLLDNLLIRLVPGQALLVFPFQFHQYTAPESPARTWLYVTFEMPECEALAVLRYMPLNMPPDLWDLVMRMVKDYHQGEPRHEAAPGSIACLLGYILVQMVKRQGELMPAIGVPSPDAPTGHRVVQQACRHMSAHLGEPVRLNEVARHVGVSEGYLRNCFREAIGIGPATYLRRMRICKSCALLHNSESNVTEIADTCGFPSLYVFSRAFKHEMGMSPSSFRKQAISS